MQRNVLGRQQGVEKKRIQSRIKVRKKFVWIRTPGGSLSLGQVGSCIKLKLATAVMLSINCCYKITTVCFVRAPFSEATFCQCSRVVFIFLVDLQQLWSRVKKRRQGGSTRRVLLLLPHDSRYSVSVLILQIPFHTQIQRCFHISPCLDCLLGFLEEGLTAHQSIKQRQITKSTSESCARNSNESNKTFDRMIRG